MNRFNPLSLASALTILTCDVASAQQSLQPNNPFYEGRDVSAWIGASGRQAVPVQSRKRPPTPIVPTPPTVDPSPTGIPRGKALEELQAGNLRFVRGGVYTHSWLQERLQVTSGDSGQTPSVGVLSCADSRVPVEMIFDRSVGDLFVVRVAGNFQDEGAVGTFEFGVGALGVHTLLVLGHTQCGAVNAARQNATLPGSIPAFVRSIRPALEAAPGGVAAIKSVDEAAEINVRWQMQQLLARSEILRKAREGGRLQLLLGIYDVSTGVVRFLN